MSVGRFRQQFLYAAHLAGVNPHLYLRAAVNAALDESCAPDARRCEITETKVTGLAYATYARSDMGEEAVALE